MRFALALAVLGSLLGGESVAGGGHQLVTAKPREQAVVPAGAFAWGLDEDEMEVLDTACRASQSEPATCEEYRNILLGMAKHTVYLDAFAIDRREVTVADYRRCVAAGGCALDPLISGDQGHRRSDLPVVNITWAEAGAYCAWTGGRLPSEAEWERAARGFEGRAWPWGDSDRPNDWNHGKAWDEALRVLHRVRRNQNPSANPGPPAPLLADDSDGHSGSAPPGSYRWGEGPHATLDQAGNVAEWTADAATIEGYRDLSRVNPLRRGDSTSRRIFRGGSWASPPFTGRTGARDPRNSVHDADQRAPWLGVRCVRSVAPHP